MQDELIFFYSVELGEPSFGEGPESLDAVDVALSPDELVLAMEDSIMVVAVEDQAVVGLPAVGVYRAALEHFALYYRHQSSSAHRSHNCHENLPAPLEQTEYRRLPGGSSTSLATNSASSEVGFVDLDLAGKPHNLLVLP